MLHTAIILVGGMGTRLREVLKDLPKPMAPVNNRPFLEYQLRFLAAQGIRKVCLSTGHLAEKIQAYFGEEFLGLKITYAREQEALGTGGGIRLACEPLNDKELLVLNGDSYFDMDLNNFYSLHSSRAANCSLALRKVDNASRYGRIDLDEQNRIISFREKSDAASPGLINAGIYILDRELYLTHTPANENFSIEKDFFARYCGKLDLRGFSFEGYFIDIGIPEDYRKVQDDFKQFGY